MTPSPFGDRIKPMPKKIFLLFLIFFSATSLFASDYAGEKIVYAISPVGTSEYQDKGMVELNSKKANLVIFHTRTVGLDDTETIYSQPEDLLPLRVERDIKLPVGQERIVEEYQPEKFLYIMRKFKEGKQVEEKKFVGDGGPIQNAITLPFYLRKLPDLKIGWSFVARFPEKFEIKLVNVEEVQVPAGKFMAYHFTSSPDKFEIWISQDSRRIPVKIKGLSGLGYALLMSKYRGPDKQ